MGYFYIMVNIKIIIIGVITNIHFKITTIMYGSRWLIRVTRLMSRWELTIPCYFKFIFNTYIITIFTVTNTFLSTTIIFTYSNTIIIIISTQSSSLKALDYSFIVNITWCL